MERKRRNTETTFHLHFDCHHINIIAVSEKKTSSAICNVAGSGFREKIMIQAQWFMLKRR